MDHFGLWHEQPIVVLDCETTGVEPTRGDKIVELAAVMIRSRKIADKLHLYLNPERPIPMEASLVHKIYDEDVALAPMFSEVAESLLKFCDDAVPCAYQESFDRGFLMAELWNANVAMSVPLLTWPCWINPLAWVRSADRFVTDDDGKKVSNDLVSACRRRGIEVAVAHDAMADATATAELLLSMVGDMPRCTVSELLRRQAFIGAAHGTRRAATEWRRPSR